jgi:predicted phosphodiesterase
MKIGIFADVHGNFEAVKAIVEDSKLEKCDQLICLGDAIGIGPQPLKTLEFLLKNQVTMIMGNHEQYYLMENEKLDILLQSEIQYQHHIWIKNQLTEEYRKIVEAFPWIYTIERQNYKLSFSHYPINDGWFMAILQAYKPEDFFNTFGSESHVAYFFGHDHKPIQFKDQAHDILYYNPGSAGCTIGDETRYAVLELGQDSYKVRSKVIIYDRSKTLMAFQENDVVGKEIIKKVFYDVKE